MVVHSLESEIAYLRNLAGAGWGGIASARQEPGNGLVPRSPGVVFWTPAAVGAAVGALTARYLGKRKSAPDIAVGGLVGSVVGCGAAMAWASRGFMRSAARGAATRVNAVRDERWLATNPIDYA